MFAVIFKTKRQLPMPQEYGDLNRQLAELAKSQPGFIKSESVADTNGNGISVVYWEALDAIRAWKENPLHLYAQHKGKTEWYKDYSVEICEIIRAYGN